MLYACCCCQHLNGTGDGAARQEFYTTIPRGNLPRSLRSIPMLLSHGAVGANCCSLCIRASTAGVESTLLQLWPCFCLTTQLSSTQLHFY